MQLTRAFVILVLFELSCIIKNGKSQEGRKFKSRIGFWTLRPTEIEGGRGYKADRAWVWGLWGLGCGGWGDDVRGFYDPVLVVGLNVQNIFLQRKYLIKMSQYPNALSRKYFKNL